MAPSPSGPGVVIISRRTARRLHVVGAAWVGLAFAALVVMGATIGVPTNPDGGGIGAFESETQLVLTALVGVGAVVAIRSDVAAAIIVALAATGLGVFASVQYPAEVGGLITAALVIPAVMLWLAWQRRETVPMIMGLGTVMVVLVGTSLVGASRVHDHYFGATHPDSVAVAAEWDQVDWMWSGGITSRGATMVAQVVDESAQAELVLQSALETRRIPGADARAGIVRFVATDLTPETDYRYWVGVGGELAGPGSFSTFADGPTSLSVAVGSCARTGSNGAVFDAMAGRNPDLYLALGDVHYQNIAVGEIDSFLSAFGTMLAEPGQARLYADTPIAYVWDDHDYGPNDSDASSATREAARLAYQQAVPHYELVAGEGNVPIYQAFTIGRVRFIMTDSRSERTPTTLLGEAQVEWLIDEIVTSSQSHGLVVWANPIPWIGEASATSDTWAGYPEERHRIANAIAGGGVDNLVMVSGDAHMVAIDDGTNSDYSATGGAGFPVLHAAALDRPGSVKGGPYSEGTFAGGGQFGFLDIDDDGETITVTLSGWDWTGERLVGLEIAFR